MKLWLVSILGVVALGGMALAAGCSSDGAPATPDAGTAPSVDGSVDGSVDSSVRDATTSPDGPLPTDAEVDSAKPTTLAACPTTGAGSVVAPSARCMVFTPTEAGNRGIGADVPHYALAPRTGASGTLVLFLNGSNGKPEGVIGDPAKNVYTAAIAEGHHVLGLSYRSNQSLGSLCDTDDCYLPSRLTLATGVYQAGAAPALSDVLLDEGIYARLASALTHLERNDPQGGWATFRRPLVPPVDSIAWDRVIVSGHSQGGGHAALLGKLFAVRRIVPLSSPCDGVDGTVASWLTYDAATWKTNPATHAYVFSAATTFGPAGRPIGGDTICDAHAAAWAAMGASPSRSFDDAFVCGTGFLAAHAATVECPENFDRLRSLFKL